MTTTRSPVTLLAFAVSFFLGGQVAVAQDISRYRAYVLESSVDSVIAATGTRAIEAKTIHQRPAMIQELEWRAPFVSARDSHADPVRAIAFTFYNDALYQVIVHYDRQRTEGLTNSDIVESLSASYGAPLLASARAGTGTPGEAVPDGIVLARWENAVSLVTLSRRSYAPEFRLMLLSKRLSSDARRSILESARLDGVEAPERAAELRNKEAGDASAALERARIANKAAFRP
jgi:hypothetical protein